MLYVPRVYQPPMTKFVLDTPRCLCLARMGSGKSAATLEAIATLIMFNEVRRVLIIAPKRVAQYTWPQEVANFNESFGHLTIAAAVGTPAQRLAAVRSNPQILTINYETLEWLIDGYGSQWPFDMVVADECGSFKGLRVGVRTSVKGNEYVQGQGSVRAAAFAKIAHRYVKRYVGLNGSFTPNGLQDSYGQVWMVDGGKRLGTSFSAFQQRWFRSFTNADGYSQLEPFENAQKEIEDAIRDVCITVDPRPFLNARALVEHHIKIKLPPKARKHYDEIQDQLFTELASGNFVEAFNQGGKVNKALQIGSGFCFHDTELRLWDKVHDEKIEALKSIVSEANGENLLIRYCFQPERDMILKAFPRFKTVESLEEFRTGRVPGLVVHAASVGHGLSLQQHCRTLVDYSSNHNLGQDEQIVERVGPTRQAQSGLDRDVYRYRIIAEDTIEETSVLPRLKHKMSVQDSLLAAMQRSR
jgi:hypothetical protein